MKKTYSLYEAKAKFSEIIRQVRETGITASITYHGKPVAEIRPTAPVSDDPVAQRVAELTARGVLQPGTTTLKVRSAASRPGALQQFLDDRHRY